MDVMLDIETLGTKPGCMVVSFAAVQFDPKGRIPLGNSMFHRLELDSRFTIDPDTLMWWMQQDDLARTKSFDGPRTPIETALISLKDFIGDSPVWGNGVAFDNACMEYYFRIFGLKWPYRQDRCYRTMKGLFLQNPELGGLDHIGEELTLHDPVDDCIRQIMCLQHIYHYLMKV